MTITLPPYSQTGRISINQRTINLLQSRLNEYTECLDLEQQDSALVYSTVPGPNKLACRNLAYSSNPPGSN